MRVPTLVFLMAGLTGCSTIGGRTGSTIAAAALISDEQEQKLGLQVKEELDTKEKVRYVADPQVVEYVRGIANKVIQFANKDRPGVTWQVNVIDEPKTVNAFATPGGYLYVYTGLLMAAENEAEVAGVMAHEAGHVVGRHSARSMVDAFGMQAVSELVLGQNPGLLGQVASGIAQQGTMLAYSRSHELEADEYGVTYSSMAGYDPRGIATFFEKLAAKSGGGGGLLATWLSTHPAPPERIKHVEQIIAERKLTGSVTAPERLAAIQKRVQALPPAPQQSAAPR